MTRFTDLVPFLPGFDGPGRAQAEARRNLPAAVADSPMTFLDSPGASAGEPDRLRVGIVVWSRADLHLLDLIAERLELSLLPGMTVEVFDADRCSSERELQQFIPHGRPLNQSPYVGVWNGGQLRETASGADGHDLIARTLGLSDAEFTATPFPAKQHV